MSQDDERERHNAELREIVKWLGPFLDLIEDEVEIIDKDYNIVAYNTKKKLRFPALEVGKKCYRVFERRDGICPGCTAKVAMETGEPARQTDRTMTENGIDWYGKPHVDDVLSKALKNARGEVVGCIESVRDVTESFLTKRRLRNLSEEYKKVTYVLSHDLLAPLISIQGFVTKLSESYANVLDDKAQHYLQRILANVQFMDQLTKAMLDTSRIINQELEQKNVDVRDLALDALKQFASESERRNALVNVADDMPRAYCDPVRTVQVFTNLFSNSFKFCPEDRPPRIDIGFENSHYFFQDNGPGIPKEFQSQVFKPFSRYANATVAGLGMGLNIVNEILVKHDCGIWVDRYYTEGARFCFTLPPERPSPGDEAKQVDGNAVS